MTRPRKGSKLDVEEWGDNGDTVHVRMTHDDFDGWVFEVDVDPSHRLVRFEVRPRAMDERRKVMAESPSRLPDPDYPMLKARDFRQMPFGEMHEAAVMLCRMIAEEAEGFRYVGDTTSPVDEQALAELAAEYVKLLAMETHAAQVLADRRGYDLARVRQLLHRARQQNLLTPALPGRQGGALTDKARALLADG